MHREGTLHTYAKADFAYRKSLAIHRAMLANHITLENLDALTVALSNAIVHLDIIAHGEIRRVSLDLLLLQSTDDIHLIPTLISG